MANQTDLDREFYEAMISLTANREWEILTDELKKEIYQYQCNVLDSAQNWDQVVFTKGFTACLAYICTLRERSKFQLEELVDANVQL